MNRKDLKRFAPVIYTLSKRFSSETLGATYLETDHLQEMQQMRRRYIVPA